MAKHKRAEGGRADTSDKEWDRGSGEDMRDEPVRDTYAGGSSKVAKEARGERKRGGEAKKEEKKEDRKEDRKRETEKRHERKERKRGGETRCMEGEAAKPRLDRAKRKSGGGVGADHNPLSSASRTTERRDSKEDKRSGGE